MDTFGQVKSTGNQRGFALVYIALVTVALFCFLGLAVDIGYMYVAKGQLQNAADSAALAGASRLPTQADARTEAVAFAGKNKVAGNTDRDSVKISSNNSNTLSNDNDITVGNWNSTTYPAKPYDETRTPVNAVQVRARRTEASPGGPVDLFIGKVFGWPQMGASATAIAQRATRAGFYFVLGNGVCSMHPPIFATPQNGNMAWTSLLQPSTNANDVLDGYICPADKLPDVDVCGKPIYTTNGTADTIFQGVETDFYDPDYDHKNKTFIVDKKGKHVATWTVIVPVATVADPTKQPAPQPIWGYAKIKISKACGAGGGTPCSRSIKDNDGICGGGEKDIVIDEITCVDCANSSNMLGAMPSLVQ